MGSSEHANGANVRRAAAKVVGWLPLVVATVALAACTIGRVLDRVGHPGPTLDDAYIHFQYARAIAEGHPLRYQASAPISTGATSFLWPTILSLPYVLGCRGDALLWPAWLLSYVALFGVAYEAHRLTLPLAGRAAAVGAAAMSIAFGGFAWCAASGMEIVPFAWLVAHATRRAAAWTETPERDRSMRAVGGLLLLAFAAPLARPEGAITSLVLGAAVAIFPPRPGRFPLRPIALAFVLAAIFPNLLLEVLTGSPTSNTAQVKLLFGHPYVRPIDAATTNARLLVTTLLDGKIWSAEFLPKGASIVALPGLFAVAWRGHVERKRFRAFAVLVLALSMFVPCVYATFLWNRLRYLWPFATGWFVGVACLARIVGAMAARLVAWKEATITALASGIAAGMLASKLDLVADDVAQSASGIARQQAALGKWVDAHLPVGARVGVNDTGAIAYFGHRPTFDVVGLTTPGEGRHWVAGPASRLEHYEVLARTRPDALPTHFAVYPEWMAIDAVLGAELQEAVVTDATILGGRVMRVHEARWDRLGSGERPWTRVGTIVDAVDVADLESEAAHGYELFDARDGEQIAAHDVAPNGVEIVDGGRTNRTRERFFVHHAYNRPMVAIGRVASASSTVLRIRRTGLAGIEAGVELAHAEVPGGGWTEVIFELPSPKTETGATTTTPATTAAASPAGATAAATYEITSDGAPFASFHWWFAEAPP